MYVSQNAFVRCVFFSVDSLSVVTVYSVGNTDMYIWDCPDEYYL